MVSVEKGKRWLYEKDGWKEIGLFAVCLVFYLAFPLFDGPYWSKDSTSYATMDITREPLYPTFLWMFRKWFGEERYLMPVILFQALLAAYAAWKLAVTVKEKKGSFALGCAAAGFQFAVALLNRFVANRGSSYTVCIMTEGVGFSLYVLFIVQLYRYILDKRKKNLLGVFFYAALLASLRKQMLLTLCLMAAVFILYYLVKKRELRKLAVLLVLTGVLLAGVKAADRFYNYRVRGVWMEHSGNSMGVLCTLVYTAQDKDAELFRDDTLKRLYTEIYTRSKEAGYNMSDAPKDWVGLTSHYADCYDDIGYGIINPVVQGYIRENQSVSPVDDTLLYDAYCGSMMKTLLGQDKGRLFCIVAWNTWKGFVNSIARVHPVLNVYAVIMYLLYLVLYVWAVRRRGCWNRPDETASLAEIVGIGLAFNCGVVGITIFTQPRYMIYSMGLFYCALTVLLYDAVAAGRKKGAKSGGRSVKVTGVK